MLPIVLGRKCKGILWLYAIVCLIFDIVSFGLKQLGSPIPGQGNLFLLTEFVLLTFYYRKQILDNKLSIALVVFFSIVFICHTLFIRPYNSDVPLSVFRLNLYAGALFYLVYIIYAVLGFYKMIKNPKQDFIERSSEFWINTAILIYASGVFFIFLYEEIIDVQNKILINLLWVYLFCSLNIIKNIFLAKALSVENGSDKR